MARRIDRRAVVERVAVAGGLHALIAPPAAVGPDEPAVKLPAATPDGQPVVYQPLKELKAGERQTFEVFATAVKVGDARFRVVLDMRG